MTNVLLDHEKYNFQKRNRIYFITPMYSIHIHAPQWPKTKEIWNACFGNIILFGILSLLVQTQSSWGACHQIKYNLKSCFIASFGCGFYKKKTLQESKTALTSGYTFFVFLYCSWICCLFVWRVSSLKTRSFVVCVQILKCSQWLTNQMWVQSFQGS